jgi:5-methylcytosine-specific restriction endonuclease McrA
VRVFVLDQNQKPLDPCHPARARELLRKGRAAVFRRYPFTIILKDRTEEESVVHAHRLKIDPGSRTTGIALIRPDTAQVVFAAEIQHRGWTVKADLDARRLVRQSRRNRHTRYRQPRFDNRTRQTGWLPPSLESRLANVLTWVDRLRQSCPIGAISQELVRFDTQQMEDPEIGGIAYQQGTLAGYERREYLLEKWDRRCAYCGRRTVPLQIEHIRAQSRGGSDRLSNLTLACDPCNLAKGNRDVQDFLKEQPEVLNRIQATAQAPLHDAAVINTTRWELFRRLEATGLPLECGSGGRTKFNRTQLGLPKAHWTDAACVGASTPDGLDARGVQPLLIKACGHGSRQMCRTDRQGFPARHKPRAKYSWGLLTGDIGQAMVPSGKYQGRHVGRIAVRFHGFHQIGQVPVHPKHIARVHGADGYAYSFGETLVPQGTGGAAPPTAEAGGFPPRRIL